MAKKDKEASPSSEAITKETPVPKGALEPEVGSNETAPPVHVEIPFEFQLKRVSVRFLRVMLPYNTGDLAGFEKDHAQALVDGGWAEYVTK